MLIYASCQFGNRGLTQLIFQAALEEPVGQVELCLYSLGREVVSVGQAVVSVPEILQLDVPLVDETGQTIIDAAQGHTHVSAEFALGPPGVLGQKAEYLDRVWMAAFTGIFFSIMRLPGVPLAWYPTKKRVFFRVVQALFQVIHNAAVEGSPESENLFGSGLSRLGIGS